LFTADQNPVNEENLTVFIEGTGNMGKERGELTQERGLPEEK
jgi:hypothetical protein